MTDLHLSASEVSAVRRVLTIDAPADDVGLRTLLEALHRLIPSDCLGIGLADRHGFLEQLVVLPEHTYDDLDPQVCDGPLHVGVEQVATSPYCRDDLADLAAHGIRDCLRVGFPLGDGRVAQLFFDRRRRTFQPRDVQVLLMLQPALARVARPPEPRADLALLSSAELQVLRLVADGATNQDVAVALSVSEATVRKHLEHVYRKLGVRNRTAASALVHAGSPA